MEIRHSLITLACELHRKSPWMSNLCRLITRFYEESFLTGPQFQQTWMSIRQKPGRSWQLWHYNHQMESDWTQAFVAWTVTGFTAFGALTQYHALKTGFSFCCIWRFGYGRWLVPRRHFAAVVEGNKSGVHRQKHFSYPKYFCHRWQEEKRSHLYIRTCTTIISFLPRCLS